MRKANREIQLSNLEMSIERNLRLKFSKAQIIDEHPILTSEADIIKWNRVAAPGEGGDKDKLDPTNRDV